jgi:hypothetical protein
VYCTVRRRLSARAAREGAMRIAVEITMVSNGCRVAVRSCGEMRGGACRLGLLRHGAGSYDTDTALAVF